MTLLEILAGMLFICICVGLFRAWASRSGEPECDHLYFPVADRATGNLVGQRCALCDKYNSIEEVRKLFEEKHSGIR